MSNSNLPGLAPRDAGQLSETEQRLRRFINQAKADNTLRAYAADWQHFTDWAELHRHTALPADPSTVALYITELADTHKTSTIKRRLSGISQVHRWGGFDSPTRDTLVQTVWSGIKREKGILQRGKAPILSEDIIKMLTALPADTSGIRDRALLLIGFAGCFRRSELVSIEFEDLRLVPEGYMILVRRSKTDQDGEGYVKGIPYGQNEETCPVRALGQWLDESSTTSGPVFRGIDRHGNIKTAGLTPKTVALVVKKAALLAGLDPSRYAGHSLRSGLATQAAMSGASETSIIKQGAWMSEKMARRYVRDGNVFRDNAASQVGL